MEKILGLKISSKAQCDLLGWHYNENGIYSVKSGYWLNSHLPTNVTVMPTYGNPQVKHQIWKCKSPPKIKHFLWRLISKSLATGSNLRRRHITRYDQCRRCCNAVKTEDHLFFGCPYAQMIWRASGVANNIILDPLASLEDKIQACLSCSFAPSLAQFNELPIGILWRIWKSRNLLIFQQKNLLWWITLKQARADSKE